jgi:hypothetical protein
MSKESVARTLERLGYVELFLRMDDGAQRKVWSAPGAEIDVPSVVRDERASSVARFLAAALLASHPTRRAANIPADLLAHVYVDGLRVGASQMANPWGLPGDPGPLSQQVIALGKAATGPLLDALDDATAMTYSGSREATVGNSYHWRVKDQAAALLAALRGEALMPDVDPKKRDKAIAALRARAQRDSPQ